MLFLADSSESTAVSLFDSLPAEGVTYTTTTSLSDMFSITATEGKNVVIDANEKSYNGKDYALRVKLGGTGSLDNRNIAITVTGASKITVVGMSSSKENDRNACILDASGNKVGESQLFLGASIGGYEYSVTEAGTYYFVSEDSGINVYDIIVEAA